MKSTHIIKLHLKGYSPLVNNLLRDEDIDVNKKEIFNILLI